jgi:hypothetical protein
MPIDVKTVLADLDEMIERLGGPKDGGVLPADRVVQMVQMVQTTPDFGPFGPRLDHENDHGPTTNRLLDNIDSKFWTIGPRKSENEHIGDQSHSFSNCDDEKNRQAARARVDRENMVQMVQWSKSDLSCRQNNDLGFGPCLDHCIPMVQNPHGLQDALPAVVDALPAVVTAALGALCSANPNVPPGDVPARRWRQFLADVGGFIASGFAEQAAALGWSEVDLYGCDDTRPFARIDQAGLLWSLNGDRLVAITANAATIETRTGARQTWRRRPAVLCEWLVPTNDDRRLRHCGRPLLPGRIWCDEHRDQHAQTTLGSIGEDDGRG